MQKGKTFEDLAAVNYADLRPHKLKGAPDAPPPEAELHRFDRVTRELPAETSEIKPHPYGVELGVLMQMFRDTRALRIYEGTSEVQKLVLAKHVLEHTPAPDAGASD